MKSNCPYSEIQRTLHLFECPAWHTVRIDHRCSYIAMSKESLDRPNVVICLKQVRGKTVAEGMTRNALREFRPPDGLVECLLDVCFMKMIPPQLLSIRHVGQ